ncbi:MAG: hypothetical protein Q8R12_03420 [bacterium]|nr:hypothetical protein [bacterium]
MTTETTYFGYCIIVHSHNGNLLTVEDTKKILKNQELTDEKATEIRDGFRLLSEVIREKWLEERKVANRQRIETKETKV